MSEDVLADFHPIVRQWFTETLGEPSAPQRAGWPAIASGSDTLILAPTGTGKTLAAFLWELNALITEGSRRRSPTRSTSSTSRRSRRSTTTSSATSSARSPSSRQRVRGSRRDVSRDPRRRSNGRHAAVARARRCCARRRTSSSRRRSRCTSCSRACADARCSARCAPSSSTRSTPSPAPSAARTSRSRSSGSRALAPDAPQRIGLSATQRPLDEIARFSSVRGCRVPRATALPARRRSSTAGS